MTDLSFSAQQDAFRREIRDWLARRVPREPLPSMDTADGFRAHQEWERTLYEAGWAVVGWPEEYGGRGLGLDEWLIFEEEYWRAGAPGRVGQNGIFLFAPTVFAFGTEEQRARVLPPMASGEEVWAQGWSEPEAGSDLANLRARAVRDEARGGWRLSGQKTWSSRAAYAHRLFGLFRSDPDSRRHHGLTYFMVDLAAPGVTVRPIRQLDGEAGFAEVFLDDVFVADRDVLGEAGEGWRIAMSTTGSERGLSLRSPGRFLAAADRLLDLCRLRPEQAAPHRDAVADVWMRAEAYRLYTYRTVTRMREGKESGPESSLNKVFWSELDLDLHDIALRVLGAEAERCGPWLDGYLFALAGPIYAGTNEIQRNVIAERLLGLPRESRR
ncbi:acyl-CoA dehydrogenase family protein [Streptomyces sp. NPDC008317]|uniref:acyl-CoA dehydrogenase family protein n=1 Tax=Streptomyces sp. NPDC008317 TaxID=3364827 RepID=UPI0036EA1750